MYKSLNVNIKSELQVKEFPGLPRREDEKPLDYFERVCRSFDIWLKQAITVEIISELDGASKPDEEINQETCGDQGGEVEELPKTTVDQGGKDRE